MEKDMMATYEMQRNADLHTMLNNMDMFDSNVGALREKFAELFKLRPDLDSVEITHEESDALYDWLEQDIESSLSNVKEIPEMKRILDEYGDAINVLRGEPIDLDLDSQVVLLQNLKKHVVGRHDYWGEKHRGKGLVYSLIELFIDRKELSFYE